ncbi:hypothetical protein [Streptosporangium roseum]|uniref:hypothetical protein n=1 Tax=Streptosporangium roseum TaxID=2001 RepID=UPI0009DD791B|nr:hypothetical protein [Streptosporangium roseum]
MKIPIFSPSGFDVTTTFSATIAAGAVSCSAVVGGHSAPAAAGDPWNAESQVAAVGAPWNTTSTDGTARD